MKGRNIFGGLFIILIGLIFLLNNLGIIGWNFWLIFADFWPLLLIIAGISIIFRRSVIVQVLMLLLLFVLPLVFYLNFGSGQYPHWMQQGSNPNYETYNWSLPKNTEIKTGSLDLDIGAGKVSLKSTDMLAALEAKTYGKPRIEEELSGNNQELKISQDDRKFTMPRMNFMSEEWALSLSKEVIWDLDIDTGAATAIYDLSGLKFSKLDLDSGAGQLRVIFGDTGQSSQVDIDCGAGEVTLIIPASVGVEARLHTGVGKKDLSGRDWIQKDDTYISKNYNQAATKLKISLDAGVGAVSIITE